MMEMTLGTATKRAQDEATTEMAQRAATKRAQDKATTEMALGAIVEMTQAAMKMMQVGVK